MCERETERDGRERERGGGGGVRERGRESEREPNLSQFVLIDGTLNKQQTTFCHPVSSGRHGIGLGERKLFLLVSTADCYVY